MKGVTGLESVLAFQFHTIVCEGVVWGWGVGVDSRKKLMVVTNFAEALYPNCRFGSALGYFDGTVVTLHEGMAILEVRRKVTLKSAVSGVGLVSDISEGCHKSHEMAEASSNPLVLAWRSRPGL